MRFLQGEAVRAPRLSEFKKHLNDALRHTGRFSAGLMLPGISVHSLRSEKKRRTGKNTAHS